MTQTDIQQAVESIWALFRETDRRSKETDRQIKEISEQFKETDRRLDQQSKETDRRFKETDRQFKEMREQSRETDRQFKEMREQSRETDRQFKETDQRIDRLFEETDRRFKETDRQFKEMREQSRETDQRIDRLFEETDRRFKETDRQFKEMREQSRETDRQFKETDQRIDRIMAETQREIATLSKQIRATEGLFTGQWGRLMEALVRAGVVRLFQDWGIPVSRTQERVRARRNGKAMELDLLLVNGEALVVVEVKTTLRANHVRELLEDLQTFPDFFPEYRDYRRFGAVAALAIEQAADRHAYRQGLFVLTLGREGLATLHNDEAFQPRDFTTGHRVQPTGHPVSP